jgi:hypothetical protein
VSYRIRTEPARLCACVCLPDGAASGCHVSVFCATTTALVGVGNWLRELALVCAHPMQDRSEPR